MTHYQAEGCHSNGWSAVEMTFIVYTHLRLPGLAQRLGVQAVHAADAGALRRRQRPRAVAAKGAAAGWLPLVVPAARTIQRRDMVVAVAAQAGGRAGTWQPVSTFATVVAVQPEGSQYGLWASEQQTPVGSNWGIDS